MRKIICIAVWLGAGLLITYAVAEILSIRTARAQGECRPGTYGCPRYEHACSWAIKRGSVTVGWSDNQTDCEITAAGFAANDRSGAYYRCQCERRIRR